MKRISIKKWQVALFFIGLCLCLCQAARGGPSVYTDKVETTPDLGQRDGTGYLPFEGQGYCAPVAVSNGLMWLYENGFPGLVREAGTRELTHLRLASLLGGARYMHTDPKKGTGPSHVMAGLFRYLTDQGYERAVVQYQGWRSHPKFSHTGVVYPDLAWIKEGLVGGGAVWLNIGWYNYDGKSATYTRVGGHWVTVVGYGADREGNQDPETLAILDPALQKTVRGSMPVYVKARKIETAASDREPMISVGPSIGYMDKMAGLENETVTEDQSAVMKATGFLKLTGELKTANRADFALVDGAVVLRMDKDRRRRARR
ncbi:MAG: hypothetical protein JEZ02_00875 [Desulfatibacillum sp.]|nr:hypothetical protein [Desulfatibacillum sp.]